MSYKSSNFRRTQDAGDAPSERGNAKVRQLQEMFPTWSDDDLKSLLQEVNYDIEIAATRISEGHAEQWGAVTRKKDKHKTHASATSASSDRGSSRGARGGRGGSRAGRGGGGRGAGRGGHRETNGRYAPSPSPQATTSETHATPVAVTTTTDAGASTEWLKTNGASDPIATSGWGDDSSANAEASSTPNHGRADATPSAWVSGASSSPAEPKSQAPTLAPVPVAKPAAKTPATSKMSWAQIAKPHEKLKATPTPAPAPSAPAPAPAPAPAQGSAEPAPAEPVAAPPEPEEKPQVEASGWEEPTTAQAPTWDDEPSAQPTVKATADGWITSVSSQTETRPAPVQAPQPSPPKHPEPVHIPVPSAFPVQLGLQQQKTDSSAVTPAKPSTPVSYARSLNSRAGNRFKTTDQAVVMPSTFGSSVEKLGMQFGSVNLGGDDFDLNASETLTSEASAPSRPAPEPARESQPQATHAPPPAEPAPASKDQSPLISTQSLFSQAIPQQVQPQPQQSSQIQPSLQSAQQAPPSLLPTQPSAQSIASTQANASTATSTPLTSFSAQQQTPSSQSSISPYQQHSAQQQTQAAQHQPPSQSHVQQQHQQSQSQLHQQFSHFPSHLDQPASSQSPPQSQQPQQQQHQATSLHHGVSTHGSYYRQPEQGFQHAATPPAGQTQEAPYGSFAPLSQQLGYQAQNSHLGGFGSDHFGYNEGPRGFYDSYGQQSTFGGRNALGHDDIGKSLPSGQQGSQTAAGLPQSGPQSAQQQTTQQPQSAAQPQGPTGQPQQGYAPVPYYYNMYQPGQYYGPPYGSGYGLGQYANRYPQQQPPIFQPANPTSASPANPKGPSSVQPQSNPYAPGLYGQQHAASSYDDGYGHPNQLGPQHNQGVGGLPTNDYGKPLYGGQGIQSFMGQSSTPVQLGQRGAGTSTSPENSYKPYGPGVGVGAKDVGGAPGVGSGIAGGQGALGQGARGGVQQPSQFYAANRFSSNPGAGGPPGQQGGQQQSQGYPQGAADNFYYQRPSQNGPYWG